jgi:phage-related baseplate assembly protein
MSASLSTSTAVDLSRLPPPDVVQPLDYEAILAELIADLQARLPEFDAFLESDPAIKALQIVAYRELILRQRVNDAGRAVLVAYAAGGDLDNLSALFGVTRRELVPADPETGAPPVMEADEDLRRRVLLAPDSYSVAGPRFAYVYHALSADGDVLDASATSPAPGEVVISVLSRIGDGEASPELLAAVDSVVGADDVRPLTDEVTVQSAAIVPFEVEAALTLYAGPDAMLIEQTAETALTALLAQQHRLGRDVTRSAIIAALHVAGVQNVNLVSPAADVAVSETQAAWASSVSVTVAGIAE